MMSKNACHYFKKHVMTLKSIESTSWRLNIFHKVKKIHHNVKKYVLTSKSMNKLLSEQGCPAPAIRGGACCCTWTKQEFMEVKAKKVYMYIMWALQYIRDDMSKWHIDCWALHTKWYPSVRIDEENPSYTWSWEQVKWRSMSKQNRRWTSTSGWDCNACMIICLKDMYMAFAGHCTQSGTHQWGSTKKIQVKHDLGRSLYGGQGQNKNRRCTSMSCGHCKGHILLCHDVHFDFITHFLTSWHTFWRYDRVFFLLLCTVWRRDIPIWCHDLLFDIMTYFTYFLTFMTYHLTLWRTLWHMFWCHDVLSVRFDVITHFVMSWTKSLKMWVTLS